MSAHEPTREAVSGTDLEARLSAARAGIRRLDDALGEGFLGQRAVASMRTVLARAPATSASACAGVGTPAGSASGGGGAPTKMSGRPADSTS
jgi:hypothetical protein